MTANAIAQCVLYLAAVIGFAAVYGPFMARVYDGRLGRLERLLGPIERLIYGLAGVDPAAGMGWRAYAAAALVFNMLGVFAVYALQRLQGFLPLNPAGFGGVVGHSAFNTAASFATNTNWQGYSGELTLSYLTQMLGLTVQNFVSAATGMAVLAALIRGLRRRGSEDLGNFWADLVRTTLYILLPLACAVSLLLVWQGVPQDFKPAAKAAMVETGAEQAIPLGPAASQVAIKQLGTNGGGYYNVNSAHPLENPTPLSDFVEMWAILSLAAACCVMFGEMVADRRQGWAVLAAMTVILAPLTLLCIAFEQKGNPLISELGVSAAAVEGPAASAGGNMEGKEVRFGIADSALWASATTAASNGSVNSMHDSFTPL
ncbi:MAG: potassium-transporting ATPase subunit A, partial [Elusimicrobia bacterium]|nr:potassium-transporting ATPase subunit A [Elusimicrobiota bacterium]